MNLNVRADGTSLRETGTPPSVAAPVPGGEVRPEHAAGLSLELLTQQATRLWGLYRQKLIDYDELDRALVQAERHAGIFVDVCDSCGIRKATINETGQHLCGTCRNSGAWL